MCPAVDSSNYRLNDFIQRQDFEALSKCVNSNTSEVSQQDPAGLTPLHHAIMKFDQSTGANSTLFRTTAAPFEILECILTSPLAPQAAIVQSQDGKFTPLHLCCRNIMPDEVIIAVARVNPQAIAMQDEDGDTPLHSACRYGASDAVLQRLVELGYGAMEPGLEEELAFAKADYADGELPLHSAILHDVSGDIIELLLDAYPQAVTAFNDNFQTPLHVACECNRYDIAEVIVHSRAAMDSVTELLSMQDHCGTTPVWTLWNQYVELRSQQDVNALNALETLGDVLSKAYYGSYEGKETSIQTNDIQCKKLYTSDQAYRLLLACLGLGENIVPTAFVSLLIKDCPEILRRVDKDGKMPLHVVASASEQQTFVSPFDSTEDKLYEEGIKDIILPISKSFFPDSSMKQLEEKLILEEGVINSMTILEHYTKSIRNNIKGRSLDVLKLILNAYPAAASIPDKSGSLPLHLSTKAGLPWDGAMKDIFAAYPAALKIPDGRTGLYPFMLSAAIATPFSQDTRDINTIYQLLQCSPDIIENCSTSQLMKEKQVQQSDFQDHSLPSRKRKLFQPSSFTNRPKMSKERKK